MSGAIFVVRWGLAATARVGGSVDGNFRLCIGFDRCRGVGISIFVGGCLDLGTVVVFVSLGDDVGPVNLSIVVSPVNLGDDVGLVNLGVVVGSQVPAEWLVQGICRRLRIVRKIVACSRSSSRLLKNGIDDRDHSCRRL